MPVDRMEILKNMVAQNPTDAFARYGLAMEIINSGNLEGGVEQFRTLLEHNPNYAAGYFHCGQTLEKMGKADEARDIYKKGIDVTTKTGDAHTRSELQAALDSLG